MKWLENMFGYKKEIPLYHCECFICKGIFKRKDMINVAEGHSDYCTLSGVICKYCQKGWVELDSKNPFGKRTSLRR